MLESIQLSKSFGKLKALDEVSVRLEAGQAVSLIGPNGSGKTTFLKCLLGLVVPDSGKKKQPQCRDRLARRCEPYRKTAIYA
jgi:Cu-processing system ATP-binding protein